MKSTAHRLGLFHPTVHIWLYNAQGEILLQKRSATKDTHPSLWDVSVAGHIGAGEVIETAAQREIKEEIGLFVKPKALEKIGVFKSKQRHHTNLLDFEFHHTFLCKLTVGLEKLKKQKSEVDALKLIHIDDFTVRLKDDIAKSKYVPHPIDYYTMVLKEISSRL
jgi:isopentenyldiphosphate isomerase